MGKLELKVLGNLEIRLDDNPVSEFKSRKPQALLCYLTVSRKQHSREWLSGLFWGDMPESKARMNLSQALTTLRRLFNPFLNVTRSVISINEHSNLQTDIAILDKTNGEDIASLHQSARLYRGDFLEGFFIPKSPEFEFWMLAERSRCRENILQVLDKIVIYFISRERAGWNSAIEFTIQRLAIEPWHEETHRNLILLYAITSQRSKALKQYEKCRQILVAELGVEPGLDTTQLYEHIRTNSSTGLMEEAEDLLAEFFPHNTGFPYQKLPGSTYTLSSNIPPRSTEFIGREQEIEALEQLLINQKSRLVTITGPGGIGKTRLAVEFSERMLSRGTIPGSNKGNPEAQFLDGLFFVSLEATTSGQAIMPVVAEAIGFHMDRGNQQLLNHLKFQRLLLILDNFEHLLESASTIIDIINSAPGVQILITSREKLNIYGEQVMPLLGLAFPEDQLHNIADYPAGQLFLKSALRQDPNFTLKESDLGHLSRICQLVEGMPLALELSATWIISLPLAYIAEQIQENLAFLSTEMGGLPVRHRSLRTVIEGSLERLTPVEQILFSQLAVFEAGFTLLAAEEITGSGFSQLSLLIDKSLLRYSRNQERYFLHPLLRQYGMQMIAGEDRAFEEINQAHSEHFCQWFSNQTEHPILLAVGQKTCLDAMTIDLENTRKAWMWALEHHEYERLVGKMDSFGFYFIYRGGYIEGLRTIQSLVDTLQKADGSNDRHYILLLCSLSNWQAFFLDILGESSTAFNVLHKTEQLLNSPLLDDLDTRAEKAHNLMILARVYQSVEQRSRADLIARALDLYREVDHPLGLPFGLTTSARFSIFDGNHNEAERYLLESLEIYKKTGNVIGSTVSLTGLGNHAFVQNNYSLARKYFRESIAIANEYNSPERAIPATLFLGTAHVFSGQFDRALRVLEFGYKDAEERGLLGFQAYAQYFLGNTWLHHGNYQQAAFCAQCAIPLAEQAGEYEMLSQAKMLLSAVELTRGNFDQAYQGFKEALAFNPQIIYVSTLFGENCGNFGLACSLLGMGDTSTAQDRLYGYLQEAVNSQRMDKAMYALSGLAKLFVDQNEIARSIRLFRFSRSMPFVHNSRWIRDVIVDPIRDQLDAQHAVWDAHYEPGDIWDVASELLSHHAKV